MNPQRVTSAGVMARPEAIVFRTAAELEKRGTDIENLISHGLPWILAAGRAYYYWLCGGKEGAERAVGNWIRRPDSESSIHRMLFAEYDSKIAGGSIELNGAELKEARTADVDSLWEILDMTGRQALLEKLTQSADLFAPVAEDEYYGSKMTVSRAFRGQGLAGFMMQRWLDRGNELGYSKFRLDVQAENAVALKWYLEFGFTIFHTGQSADGALRYYGMRLERKPQQAGLR